MDKEKNKEYGDYEQVNGAVVNSRNDRIAELEAQVEMLRRSTNHEFERANTAEAKLAMVVSAFTPIPGNYFDASNTCSIIKGIISDVPPPLAVIEAYANPASNEEYGWWFDTGYYGEFLNISEFGGWQENQSPVTVVVLPRESEGSDA